MNTNYTCVIIDDSRIDLDLIYKYLSDIPNLEIKGTFEDGIKAISYLSENNVDIVISDIEMPNLKGIELVKILKTSPMFIFVTSHPGFAVNGFELDAVDYIIKPVNKLRLVKAVNKAIKQINSSVEAIETKKVTDIEELPYNQSFFIKENNNIVKLNTCDVLYIESLSDFSKFYLTNNRSHLVLANLKSVESQLPQKIFQRVHRQFVINMDKISTLTPTEIELTDDKIVPLGSTYKQTLMDLIENRIISR